MDNKSEMEGDAEPLSESPRSGTGSSLGSEDIDEGGREMQARYAPLPLIQPAHTEDMATARGDQLSTEENPTAISPIAFVNVRVSRHSVTVAAMPNVRDISISARKS